ncbi:hypothetical protein MF271_20580 (plasmid) [Deinococcus sp. KNUC1210]|uniref:hypothetical protein n=1 Tax=Deinococcus sp. KNUC1210 TaxID=2917691 RepID=UPI001EF06917|nr:hypothetical protein [Deinococcus sp. KNUC1210]ULH17456.1 hypothetical protein MF271_20580 [Deinococcus sp. KNUC1210]
MSAEAPPLNAADTAMQLIPSLRPNRVSRLWQQLAPDVSALLSEIQSSFVEHQTQDAAQLNRAAQASVLCRAFQDAWDQERVDLDTLWALDAMTDHLNLAPTLQCRAALETIYDHLRRVVELIYEELSCGNG